VRLYGDGNPLDAPGFETKVKLLAEIDAYVRDKEPRVRQATVFLGATWQVVEFCGPMVRAIATFAPRWEKWSRMTDGEERPRWATEHCGTALPARPPAEAAKGGPKKSEAA
jgi:hypothetical protein